MAAESKEPKLVVPKDMYAYLNAHFESVVKLLSVAGQPSFPIDHAIVEAMIVEHLNHTGDAKPNRIDVVKNLLLAQAIRNGVQATDGLDLYLETTLVIAIVLYVGDHPDGFDTNTLEIKKKLVEFANTKGLETANWPSGLGWFSHAIENSQAVLKHYGVIATKVSDGHRSWVIKKQAETE